MGKSRSTSNPLRRGNSRVCTLPSPPCAFAARTSRIAHFREDFKPRITRITRIRDSAIRGIRGIRVIRGKTCWDLVAAPPRYGFARAPSLLIPVRGHLAFSPRAHIQKAERCRLGSRSLADAKFGVFQNVGPRKSTGPAGQDCPAMGRTIGLPLNGFQC